MISKGMVAANARYPIPLNTSIEVTFRESGWEAKVNLPLRIKIASLE